MVQSTAAAETLALPPDLEEILADRNLAACRQALAAGTPVGLLFQFLGRLVPVRRPQARPSHPAA